MNSTRFFVSLCVLRGLIILLFVIHSFPILAANSEKISVEIPVFAGGEGMGFFTDCAREYEKLHPDVDINLYGDNRVDDKVRIRVLEGTLFDITNASLNWWGLIKRGDVEPLDAVLDQTSWDGDTSWRDSFVPGSLSVYQYQGKTYALPLCWFVSGIWYNKVMFREHGWNKPKTWDEFFQLCDQIKQGRTSFTIRRTEPKLRRWHFRDAIRITRTRSSTRPITTSPGRPRIALSNRGHREVLTTPIASSRFGSCRRLRRRIFKPARWG